MHAAQRRLHTRLLQIVDGLLFVGVLLLAYWMRAAWPWLNLPALESWEKYLWLAPLVAVLGPTMLASQGFYATSHLSSHLSAALCALRGATFLVLGLVLTMFLVREQYARSVIILVGALGGTLAYARHEFVRWLNHFRVARVEDRRRILWIGLPAENARLQSLLSATEKVDVANSAGDFDPTQRTAEELCQLLHDEAINLAIVNYAGCERHQLAPLLTVCEREGIELVLRPDIGAASPYLLVADEFAGEPVFYYRAQTASPAHLLLKQLFDYGAAGLLLVALLPVGLVLALAIKGTSRGPVFYRQPRAGLNGRAFTLIKFRSMRAEADREQAALADRNEMRGPVFKVRHDPRVTPLGRFLRRYSLDELPQLWNVLRGEMSLVGPRPLPLEEVRRFTNDAHRRRLSVKPGLTCLWQVQGRNDIADFEDWVRLDLAYIDQWSLWLDVRILLATVPVVLFGRGGR